MRESTKRSWTATLGTILFICVVGVGLLAFARYWTVNQLESLGAEQRFSTPEEGASAAVKDMYLDIEMIEVVGAQRKYGFEDLELVVVHVWANALADGSSFGLEDYDNVALFFLELEGGWVHVPEGRAQFIAMGKHFFRL
jgi:hypothetical protein